MNLGVSVSGYNFLSNKDCAKGKVFDKRTRIKFKLHSSFFHVKKEGFETNYFQVELKHFMRQKIKK